MNSIISPRARIGDHCTIGDFVKIHDRVVLGPNSVVEDYCVLGYPCAAAGEEDLIIGANALIRSHSILYQGSQFGAHLQTGSFSHIREKIQAGDGLRVGTKSDLQGYSRFGNWVMIHSQVHVAKDATIGDFVWLFPRVTFTDDPLPPSHVCKGVVVEDMAVICTGALLLPGVRIGQGALVAAASVVKRSVAPVTVVEGNPAAVVCKLRHLNLLSQGTTYPWHDHFADRYPAEAQPLLREVGERIRQLMQDGNTDSS